MNCIDTVSVISSYLDNKDFTRLYVSKNMRIILDDICYPGIISDISVVDINRVTKAIFTGVKLDNIVMYYHEIDYEWDESLGQFVCPGLPLYGDTPTVNGKIREYLVDGLRHRDNGPAVISDQYQAWYRNGEPHREDGPAEIDRSVSRWYNSGELHRVDGPAVIDRNREEWYIAGDRHREDGPAVIDRNCQTWYKHGERHREDGPAYTCNDYEEWYFEDKLHRVDGPAVTSDEYQEWYIFGKFIKRENY